MTRAAEFCYIVETPGMPKGQYLLAVGPSTSTILWTKDPEQALRVTKVGQAPLIHDWVSRAVGAQVTGLGFRKILAG